MTEESSTGNVAGTAANRRFTLVRVYIKDLSFEAPASPAMFDIGHPNVNLSVRTTQRELGENEYEVALHVAAQAMVGERTAYLVEIEQAGIFSINGFPQDETRSILGIVCPNALFPYAREAIASLVQRGGFAQLVLQPIDFTDLFSQARRMAGATQAG